MIKIESDLTLPESLRDRLKEPFGKVLESEEIADELRGDKSPLITIGDSVSKALIDYGLFPNVIIWDGKTMRKNCDSKSLTVLEMYAPQMTVSNPAGTITKEAWDAVILAISGTRASIKVKGEEDLLAIPAILNAPAGSHVVYGHPGKGAILIVVDGKIKSEFQEILSLFEK